MFRLMFLTLHHVNRKFIILGSGRFSTNFSLLYQFLGGCSAHRQEQEEEGRSIREDGNGRFPCQKVIRQVE